MNHTKLDFATHLDFSSILTNPILDIAARVWEEERYEAFKICYRSMRRIDDLVDHRKSTGQPLSVEEIATIETMLATWVDSIHRQDFDDQFHADFIATLNKFRLPFWPWQRLCRAMIYDLTHNGFASLHMFLRYCEGAAISPAAVFMHLCGAKHPDNQYTLPPYDIRDAARPLAIYSYLVHIMRDFEKDQRDGLNYFADSVLFKCHLTKEQLRSLALEQRTPPALRSLFATYVHIAEYYRRKARATIDRTLPLLAPRYQLSLELIYSLYTQIFERIDPEHGEFTAQALGPDRADIQARIAKTINDFTAII